MDDVAIVKAAHYVGNGVSAADMSKKLIAKTLALTRTTHETCDIHKFHGRWNNHLGLRDLGQDLKPGVRNCHDSHVGIDCAEWVVGRLRLSDEEVHSMAIKLSAVLDYVSTLSAINVDGIEPMAHPIDVSNAFRDDVPKPGLPVETVLANAPDQSPPFFKVPKVIDDGGGA